MPRLNQENKDPERNNEGLPFKVALIYAVFSALWILLSDQILYLLVKNPMMLTQIQMMKGWIFIAVSAGVIFFLLRSETRRSFQAEAVLKKREFNYRLLADNTTDVIFVLDTDLNYTYVSPAVKRLRGYTPEELMGTSSSDTLTPRSLALAAKTFSGFLEQFKIKNRISRMSKTLELEMRCKDGTTVWTEVMLSILFNEAKSPGGIIGVARDITDRKKIQDAFWESEERFRQIYEHMMVGIAQVSMNLTIKRANKAYCSMLGYGEREMAGRHLKDITHPEVLEENLLKQSWLAKGEIDHYRMEKKFIHKNGTIVHGILDANLVRDSQGRPAYFLGVVSDITYLKNIEKELKSEKQLLEGVLDSIKDVIGVQLPDHTILQYNRAGYDLLGVTPEDVKGKKCYELIGRKRPCDTCATATALSSRKLETLEKYIPELGKHFLCKSNPVLDETRTVKFVIEQLTDITELKKMDEQLRQSQKMESVGNLAGGIAHDFNNILFPILGMSELLLEDFTPGTPEYSNVNEILKAGKRGSELVKQILSFSRQDENRMMPIFIQDVLKEVLKLTRSTIPSDIEIKQNICRDCSLIQGNATQIHQVTMNLITNAFHAVEGSPGHIRVLLSEENFKAWDLKGTMLTPGRYIKLCVADNGCGIPPSAMDKIFEPYFTTKEKGKGTGLGLSVVYGIVKDHHGDIKVRSTLNKGTRFEVFFPVMDQAIPPEKPETEAVPKTGTERILLVDDEEAIANLEKRMLERLGYQATEKACSVEALEVFKASPAAFDLVITDLAMPKMTGDRFARKIREIRPEIPIILCTGFSDRMDKAEMEKLGIKGLLMKPVVKSELADTVRGVLDGGKDGDC